jgi:hypothetical protein
MIVPTRRSTFSKSSQLRRSILYKYQATLLNPNPLWAVVIENVGANLDDDGVKPRFRLLRTLAKLCQPPLGKESAESESDSGGLSRKSIARLAANLLEANRHLFEFEVELGDRRTSDAVADELAAKGCKVRKDPFKSLLFVTCPDLQKLHRAA